MPLEQHPVPQQISSYQFRLVGDMTLKQFFQLAGGAGIGLLVYGSPLPLIIKWPLIIFFVMMGAAFAFLPIQDRPLSVWLLAFFRSIYSPTIYTWVREQQPEYFAAEDTERLSISQGGENAQTQGDIQAQFGEVASGFLENLEGAEERYLSKITGLFKHEAGNPSANGTGQVEHPTIINAVSPAMPAMPHFPVAEQTANVQTLPVAPVPLPPAQPVMTAPSVVDNQTSYFRPVPKPPAEFMQQVQMQTQVTQPLNNPMTASPTPMIVNPTPTQEPVTIYRPQPNTQASQNIYSQATQKDEDIVPVFQQLDQTPTPPANNLSDMETPTQANILVGRVLDTSQSPLSNVIMEIKDEFGRPVRALKTDKDGKFRIVTPLHDGNYTIYTEKDRYEFEPVQLELQNTIVEPMIIEPK